MSPGLLILAIGAGFYILHVDKKVREKKKKIKAKGKVLIRALTSGNGTNGDEDISMMTASQSESDKRLTEKIFEAARKENIDPYKELGIEPPKPKVDCMADSREAIAAANLLGCGIPPSMIPGCGPPMGIDIHNQHSEPVKIDASMFFGDQALAGTIGYYLGNMPARRSISHSPDFDLPVDYIYPSREFSDFILENVEGLYAIGVYRMRGSRHYIAIAEIRMMNRALLMHSPKSSTQRIAEYCMQVIQYFINEDGNGGMYKAILVGNRDSSGGRPFKWEKQKHVDTRQVKEVEEQR